MIKNIWKGWKNWLFPTKDPLERKVYDDRMATCLGCDFYKRGVCAECGCVLKAKTKVLSEMCPENKWNPEVLEHNGVQFIRLSKTNDFMRWKYFAGVGRKIKQHQGLPPDAVLLDDWIEFWEEYQS